MVKKFSVILIAVLFFSLFSSIPSADASSNDLKIYVNFMPQNYSKDAKVEKGVTLVPMRNVFQSLGASVTYNSKTKTITAKKGKTTITLVIGSKTAKVNGKSVKLLAAAKAEKGVTLVPLRFVSDALDEKVRWHAASKSIIIGDPDYYKQLFGKSKATVKKYEKNQFVTEILDSGSWILFYKTNMLGRSNEVQYYLNSSGLVEINYDFFPTRTKTHSRQQLKSINEKLLKEAIILFGEPSFVDNIVNSKRVDYYASWDKDGYKIALTVNANHVQTEALLNIYSNNY